MLPLLIDAVLDTILIDDILLLVAARSFAVLIETTPDEYGASELEDPMRTFPPSLLKDLPD
jgi:hypothetical protein